MLVTLPEPGYHMCCKYNFNTYVVLVWSQQATFYGKESHGKTYIGLGL